MITELKSIPDIWKRMPSEMHARRFLEGTIRNCHSGKIWLAHPVPTRRDHSRGRKARSVEGRAGIVGSAQNYHLIVLGKASEELHVKIFFCEHLKTHICTGKVVKNTPVHVRTAVLYENTDFARENFDFGAFEVTHFHVQSHRT